MTTTPTTRVAVVGLGEVGAPLAKVLEEAYDVVGIDLPHPPLETLGPVAVMHVCFPYEIPDFVEETNRYAEGLQPALIVIDSTVGVGTTRQVQERTGRATVHSPVRGKHTRMAAELTHYTKYVGGVDRQAAEEAARHYERAGLTTRVLARPEATELAKLSETTYFGLLISWAQELERYCDRLGLDYDEIVSFYEEIAFFPRAKYYPGVIGGHCVMPNIEILRELGNTDFLAAIKNSNEAKQAREHGTGV